MKLKLNFCSEVQCAKEFAEFINSCTFQNLTGGIMVLQVIKNKIAVYGCNLDCSITNNVMYIDGEPAVDFDKREILIDYAFDE